MTDHGNSPSERGVNWFMELLRNLHLAWRLFWDPLVPTWLKLIPVGAILYILFVGDLVPDIIPGLGQLDDLGVLVLSIKLLLSLCPKEILERHQRQMSSVEGSYRVVEEEAPQEPPVAGYLDSDSSTPASPQRTKQEPDKVL
ncbi:MAG: YkvA family protein [Anaerolineae bacterium]